MGKPLREAAWVKGMLVALLFGLNASLLAAAEKGAAPAAREKLVAKPNVVLGQVLTEAGKPVAGVAISLTGTTKAGQKAYYKAKTDAEGKYSVDVAEGSYRIEARYSAKYNDRTYLLDMEPAEANAQPQFSSAAGAVRSYVWKLSGVRPDGETQPDEYTSYYGGAVQVTEGNPDDRNAPMMSFAPGTKIEVTLTPDGPLADGSEGKAVSKTFTFQDKVNYTPYKKRQLLDVPLGKYTAKATITEPGGAATTLRVVADLGKDEEKQKLGSTTVVTFPPMDTGISLSPYLPKVTLYVTK